MNQTVRALIEAESYPGPSLVIAYSPCIAHGYDLKHGPEQAQLAVKAGVWPLYRFDPRRLELGQPPLQLDSKEPTIPVAAYHRNETRFRMSERVDPSRHARLQQAAEEDARTRWAVYRYLAGLSIPPAAPAESARRPETSEVAS
jgi:pyruvate-ferredoxin/flavodoxin oxidoreductase